MKKRKTTRKAPAKRTGKQIAVWQALGLTGQILGHIKNVQKAYLRVGQYLAKVRDEKLYEVLGHTDLADYAKKRLDLSEASLYRYLRIYDWVLSNKPEWLKKGYKGRIPELADATVAIQADEQLARNPRMRENKRKGLEALKQRALDGNLTKDEAGKALKKNSRESDPLAEFASQIRTLSRRWARVTGIPPEAFACLDSAVAVLTNEHKVAIAGLRLISTGAVATT